MDPAEVEFLAEKEIIEVIPNFTFDAIHLISGSIGPFKAGLPLNVPLWLAVTLRQQQKCRFLPPQWMDVTLLEEVREEEKLSRFFTKMPSAHYMVEAKLILGTSPEDIPRAEEIRTIIKDIWDIRMAKLRTSMDAFIKEGGTYAKLDHLTAMEMNSVRPLLPHALDQLHRLQKVIVYYMNPISLAISSNLAKCQGIFKEARRPNHHPHKRCPCTPHIPTHLRPHKNIF